MIPIRDRVLVALTPKEKGEELKDGIIVPEYVKKDEDLPRGEVISVGPDCEQVKVGDTVILPKYLTANLTYEGREMTIIREDELLGIE